MPMHNFKTRLSKLEKRIKPKKQLVKIYRLMVRLLVSSGFSLRICGGYCGGEIFRLILNYCYKYLKNIFMAERQGFEPWVPVKGQRFSRPPRSTTPAPLHAGRLSFLNPTCKWFFIAVHAVGISTWHFPGTRS